MIGEHQDFLQRLEPSGVSLALPYLYFDSSSVYKLECPRCKTQVSQCVLCPAVMCLNKACTVSRVALFHSCSRHFSTAVCLPCWERDMLDWQPIDQCPQCKLWYCNSEMIWCLGGPSNTRKHAAKPIGCFPCTGNQQPPVCANEKCWSNVWELITGVCESCSPEGGLWCRCRQSWIYDLCRESAIFAQCPRCRKVYCPDGCNYIGGCAECNGVTLCNDCFEEDWSCFEGMDVGVVTLKGKCSNHHICTKRVCADCPEYARCGKCHKTFCPSCL